MTTEELKKKILKNYERGEEEEAVFTRIIDFEGEIKDYEIQTLIDEAISKADEWAEEFIDEYSEDVLYWYMEDLGRLGFADDVLAGEEEAIAQLGADSIEEADTVIEILRLGQKLYWKGIINDIIDRLLDYIKEKE